MPSEQPSVSNQHVDEQLLDRIQNAYVEKFGKAPTLLVAAPGRVNLIGEHIDYNDGFVMPMAIQRYVVIAAGLADDSSRDHGLVHSVELEETEQVSLVTSPQPKPGSWINYVAGVIAGFLESGVSIPAFDAVVDSNVPVGGGLSSSAALEVATATLVEAITGKSIGKAEKALICQQAEHKFAGVPCGIMDQFSSVFGKPNELMLLDCQSQQIEPVPFQTDEITVLITNSNVKHELTGGEYAERRSGCDSAKAKLGCDSWRDMTIEELESKKASLSESEYRLARHVVTEISRTTDAANAFANGDYDQVGQLMYASHDSLRDDFEVSCDELDILVEIARAIGNEGGVIGSRMTGGGFGGCTVTLVKTDHLQSVTSTIQSEYKSKTGIEAMAFATRPAMGAHVIATTP
ncbi:Galactokinase [Rubripirellula obstinata]|uniref:Galactokinase n=1 Tax=Rubripirellula obstinata TaxID=406547 RepID=A0A5B1CI78_9BACT|nr:galactokinase [Rubripirellula obstinata]KAA1259399.1 Galactokinase [Rubripirellula obstinata]